MANGCILTRPNDGRQFKTALKGQTQCLEAPTPGGVWGRTTQFKTALCQRNWQASAIQKLPREQRLHMFKVTLPHYIVKKLQKTQLLHFVSSLKTL